MGKFKRATQFIDPKLATPLQIEQVVKVLNFPTGVDVSDRHIVITELGGYLNLGDVFAFCRQHNVAVPKIDVRMLDGALETSSDADGEVALDVCIVAIACPGTRITVLFGQNTNKGFDDVFAAAAALNPDAVSNSWGGPESSFEASDRASMDATMQAAAEKGTAFFCASGDNGSSDGQAIGNVCDYPASSPFAISCGGTHLELNLEGSRASETAWSTGFLNGEGSGGGVSACYSTTPNWQQGLLPNLPAGRRSPDLSANADPNTGYEIEINGVATVVGGTSAVAPVLAAGFTTANARIGAHIGNLHTKIYEHPECFYVVTQGTNGKYSCTDSYSCVTGLGVIDFTKFIEAIG